MCAANRFQDLSSVLSGETFLPREKYGKPKPQGVLGKGIQPGYNAHTKYRLGGSGLVYSVPTDDYKSLVIRGPGDKESSG